MISSSTRPFHRQDQLLTSIPFNLVISLAVLDLPFNRAWAMYLKTLLLDTLFCLRITILRRVPILLSFLLPILNKRSHLCHLRFSITTAHHRRMIQIQGYHRHHTVPTTFILDRRPSLLFLTSATIPCRLHHLMSAHMFILRHSYNLIFLQLSGPNPLPYHSHVPVLNVESHVILPPHQQSPTSHHPPSQPEPPIMDHLPPPSPPVPPSHTHMTHQVSFNAPPSDLWRDPNHVNTPWQYEPLSQSSIIRADGPPFSTHPLHPTQQAVYRSIRSQSHPNRHNIQPQGWPMVCTPSPTMQFSPLPSDRQLEKKPPLACLFCRGRKIACGPPEPGSEDPTCK